MNQWEVIHPQPPPLEDDWNPAALEQLSARRQALALANQPKLDAFAAEWSARIKPRRQRAAPVSRTQRRQQTLAGIEAGLLSPQRPREVIDAYKAGLLEYAEARSLLGFPANWPAQPELVDASRGARAAGYLRRVVWGICWRSGLSLAVFVAAGLGYGPGPALWAAAAVCGLLLGLWHRHRWGIGPVYRSAAASAATVYMAPLAGVFPPALVGLLGLNALLPWFSARRRRLA